MSVSQGWLLDIGDVGLSGYPKTFPIHEECGIAIFLTEGLLLWCWNMVMVMTPCKLSVVI